MNNRAQNNQHFPFFPVKENNLTLRITVVNYFKRKLINYKGQFTPVILHHNQKIESHKILFLFYQSLLIEN